MKNTKIGPLENFTLYSISMCDTYHPYILYSTAAVPSITEFEATSNPVVGNDFTIRCSAQGTPRPTITWKKDGSPLEPTEDGVLRIVSTDNLMTSSVEVSEGRLEFNGVYECIAMNPAGFANKSSRIQLQGWW